ncbi:MAG: hypothetical protein GC180_00315 [Bacteroidetes bacterium]|nr:hypothetical protein [Bacteroidota bacterium]
MQRDLKDRGIIRMNESLLDHLCCLIENSDQDEFTEAYAQALEAFGIDELLKTEIEIDHFILTRKKITMKKTMYLLGFLAFFMAIAGSLCKVMHWPAANVLLVTGGLLMNFGFLPLYFLEKYRAAKADA